MLTDEQNEQSQADASDPVAIAGCILLWLAKRTLAAASGNPAESMVSIDQELLRVRHLLSQAKPKSEAGRHRYFAAKTALETLEANERREPLLPYHDQFYGHVEAVRGGEGAELFGGTRISRKPNAKTAFLRAALFVLWEHYCGDDTARSALVKEAVSLGIIGNRTSSPAHNEAVVRTRIKNIHKRPNDGQGAVASEWEHVDLIRRLVSTGAFKKLADFR